VESENQPDRWIGLFATLADTEAALDQLQAAGVPYPVIRMGTHTAAELEHLSADERQQIGGTAAPEQFWSLALTLDPSWRDKAIAVLRERRPFALGYLPGLDNRRDDTERGAIAWRHYVFETDAATSWAGESAGTTGTTGVISSGVFADGALAEGNPPAHPLGKDDQRPSDAGQQPTSDTMQPKVSNAGSRPQTELTNE
jgi:hypothetical protein